MSQIFQKLGTTRVRISLLRSKLASHQHGISQIRDHGLLIYLILVSCSTFILDRKECSRGRCICSHGLVSQDPWAHRLERLVIPQSACVLFRNLQSRLLEVVQFIYVAKLPALAVKPVQPSFAVSDSVKALRQQRQCRTKSVNESAQSPYDTTREP